jgi:carbamoyltransferase
LVFTEHHQSHAASAFYPSPFDEAAILTVDGVGEWATTTLGYGRRPQIKKLKELRFPHSLGLLYSAFTDYCGFRINSGEYKLMGLAPYGEPKFAETIRHELLDIKADGSFWLNLDYFNFLRDTTMTNSRFHKLFNGLPRAPEGKIEQRHMDVARSIQLVTEEIMLLLARHAREVTGLKNLCMAGGVALNCLANSRILCQKIFDQISGIPPTSLARNGTPTPTHSKTVLGKLSAREEITASRPSPRRYSMAPAWSLTQKVGPWVPTIKVVLAKAMP